MKTNGPSNGLEEERKEEDRRGFRVNNWLRTVHLNHVRKRKYTSGNSNVRMKSLNTLKILINGHKLGVAWHGSWASGVFLVKLNSCQAGPVTKFTLIIIFLTRHSSVSKIKHMTRVHRAQVRKFHRKSVLSFFT